MLKLLDKILIFFLFYSGGFYNKGKLKSVLLIIFALLLGKIVSNSFFSKFC